MEKGLFNQRVYEVVRRIPKGKVATYGQVAALAGAPRNARFVGYALHSNPEPDVIPCHRVVFRDGSLAPGFAFGGPERQRLLLEEEGVAFISPKGMLIRDNIRNSHVFLIKAPAVQDGPASD